MRTLAALVLTTTFVLGQEPAKPDTNPRQPAPKPEAPIEKPQMPWTGMVDEKQFKELHALKPDQAPKLNGELVTVGGARHYLSIPRNMRPPFPSVLLVHEWWGLNDHIKHWADRLAADGYVALAVDLYGGKVATTSDDAMKLAKEAGSDVPKATAILREAFDFLAANKRVEAQKRAVLGWCFGGGMALQFAMAEPRLDATVIYYGRLIDDPKALETIHGPVLGIFGNQDPSIPPKSVDAFAAAMKTAGKTCDILRYDAEHAFANPSNARYDEANATKAWAAVRKFLEAQLKTAAKPKADESPAKK